jgi:hypothetical protein
MKCEDQSKVAELEIEGREISDLMDEVEQGKHDDNLKRFVQEVQKRCKCVSDYK